jgi:hypothetical protein
MLSSTPFIHFLTLYFLAGLTIVQPLLFENDSDITLSTRDNCGPQMGSCGNCYGANFPDLGYGICKSGYYQGCKCTLTCTDDNGSCNQNNCQGINDINGGVGLCTAGYYEGCPCQSICNGVGNCNDHGCEGINYPNGAQGVCTAGDYQGCPCNSICSDHDDDCTSNSCNGAGGVCQAGDYQGCPCGTPCGNINTQPCNQYGCAGINIPDLGLGICTGSYLGCACTLVCPTPNVACSDSNCMGNNGVCSTGTYNGCYCD